MTRRPAWASSPRTTPRGLCSISRATSIRPERALDALPHLLPAEWRFVVSIVVRSEGLPEALGGEAFLLPSWPHRGQDDAKPLVHLQRSSEPCGISGATLLVAEAVCLEGGALPVDRAREAVLDAIESLLPFIERHYLVVDSPHDGRPLWDMRSGKRKEVDRAALRVSGGSLDAEPMAARWRVESANLLRPWRRTDPHAARGRLHPGTERAPCPRSGGGATRRVERGEAHHPHRPAQRANAA